MCGIAGFVDHSPAVEQYNMAAVATGMAGTLASRGPDDSGEWVDRENGIGLAHRRLSIIDLSASGHQPMLSSDGRYVLVYNGELYNFQELRAELEARGQPFRGHSDSEVLLEACAAWGVVRAV
jgi:asparagine synthase (glutamine-hydrolysing)